MSNISPSKKMNFGDLYKSNELYLDNIGFDDFHFVPPLKIMRIQSGYTLHLVTGGKGILTINEKSHTVCEGDIFFIPPKVPMMYYPLEDDPWQYYWFYLRGNTLPDLQKLLGFSLDNPIRTLHNASMFFDQIPHLFDEDFRSARQYYKTMAMFMHLVSELCPEKSERIYSQTDSMIGQAREIIALNCTNAYFEIKMLPHVLHISHSYLCKLFKQETGISAIRFLLDARLTHATKLLLKSKSSVKEIAISSGFRNELHFMKEFKKKYGMTAGEYRRKYTNKEG